MRSIIHKEGTMDTTYTYTTTTTNIDPSMMPFFWVMFLVSFALGVLELASLWRLYKMAGQPGWAAIVPVYNIVVMLQIVGRPVWWVLLMFIPLVNFVIAIIVILDFAKAYGKSVGYGVAMLFFSFIMYPILAFSKDTKYVGPLAAQPAPAAPQL